MRPLYRHKSVERIDTLHSYIRGPMQGANSRFLFGMLVALVLQVSFCSCQTQQAPENSIQYLHNDWQFKEGNSTGWLSTAGVPGTVHTDLRYNNLIPDYSVGLNEKAVQWVEQKDWEYKTSFSYKYPNRISNVDMVFEGLDTYADVYLNDSLILQANNMFRSWRINVNELLQDGANELRILFHSPIKVGSESFDKLDYELPAGNDQGEKKVSSHVRKAPFHFGWDWGPRIVTSGIWRPVYLESYTSKISDVHVTCHDFDEANANINVTYQLESALEGSIQYFVFDAAGSKVAQGIRALTAQRKDTIRTSFLIQNPKLWWPNGLGDAHLYTLRYSLLVGGHEIQIDSVQFGVRSIDLVQEKDTTGRSFFFKVNGKTVFMKGANYIPQSHMQPGVARADYESLLADVVNSNMNMLRVWGGGIYEEDYFYKLCDQHGILVWQDFMFACSMYPSDSAFLRNVEEEVKQNIIRLRNHPSIALWCGNNEMDVAWHNWGWQKQFAYSPQDSAAIWRGYLQLFHKLIPELVMEFAATTPYITTSPLSNWGKPENFNYDNMHYWGVWHGEEAFEKFADNVPRFMSEYGFQSMPTASTLDSFADETDYTLNSEVMQWHQKSYKGNRLLESHMQQYFRKHASFNDFVYLSGLTQAKAYRLAIEEHRMAKGHCWGTLYWQLNDCWPGPTWSTIDVNGNWKAAQYEVQDRYKETILTLRKEKGTLRIYAVNDRQASLNATLKMELISFGGAVLWQKEIPVTLTENSSEIIHTLPTTELPKHSTTSTLFRATIYEGPSQLDAELLYFTAEKSLDLKDPKIEARLRKEAGGTILELSSQYLAKSVFVTSKAGVLRLQQNYFDIVPGEPMQVECLSQQPEGDKIQVSSLWHSFTKKP